MATHPFTLSINCKTAQGRLITRKLNKHIQTHGILFRRGHLLDAERVVQEAVAREVFPHVFLDELDAVIGVVEFVSDAGNCGQRTRYL